MVCGSLRWSAVIRLTHLNVAIREMNFILLSVMIATNCVNGYILECQIRKLTYEPCHEKTYLWNFRLGPSHVMRKPVFGISDYVHHNRAVQPQMARGLKFYI